MSMIGPVQYGSTGTLCFTRHTVGLYTIRSTRYKTNIFVVRKQMMGVSWLKCWRYALAISPQCRSVTDERMDKQTDRQNCGIIYVPRLSECIASRTKNVTTGLHQCRPVCCLLICTIRW